MDDLHRIRLLGDPVLRRPAGAVERFDHSLRELAARLSRARSLAQGVGIAAPQIGVGLQVFTMVIGEQELVVANPVLTLAGDQWDDDTEGCLSLPGTPCQVRRAARVVLSGQGLDGGRFEVDLNGWPARVAQHETDHLAGILIVDHAGRRRC